jgi:hypothetical protein
MMQIRLMVGGLVLAGALGPLSAWGDESATPVLTSSDTHSGAGAIQQSDREYLIANQAATMAPMTIRVGTYDQYQNVQVGGGGNPNGFLADIFVDVAPTSWLTVGLTGNYGTFGDSANVFAPTAYMKAQFLRQDTAGVNMAGEVQYKKFGFQDRPVSASNPQNQGEIEAMLLVDRRFGNLDLTGNAVFGKSYTQPDADAELKLAAGYLVRQNLLVGLDSITRYDASFDGGPKDGSRYWEFTGGPMASVKFGTLTLAALAGLSAPMHIAAIGPTAMAQVSYGF